MGHRHGKVCCWRGPWMHHRRRLCDIHSSWRRVSMLALIQIPSGVGWGRLWQRHTPLSPVCAAAYSSPERKEYHSIHLSQPNVWTERPLVFLTRLSLHTWGIPFFVYTAQSTVYIQLRFTVDTMVRHSYCVKNCHRKLHDNYSNSLDKWQVFFFSLPCLEEKLSRRLGQK